MAVEKHALNKKERALMHVLLNLAEKNDGIGRAHV